MIYIKNKICSKDVKLITLRITSATDDKYIALNIIYANKIKNVLL